MRKLCMQQPHKWALQNWIGLLILWTIIILKYATSFYHKPIKDLRVWGRNDLSHCAQDNTIPLRGYCTSYQKLACFVLYLKIINTSMQNNTCIF